MCGGNKCDVLQLAGAGGSALGVGFTPPGLPVADEGCWGPMQGSGGFSLPGSPWNSSPCSGSAPSLHPSACSAHQRSPKPC